MASRFRWRRLASGALAIAAGLVLAGVILNLTSLRADDIGAPATPGLPTASPSDSTGPSTAPSLSNTTEPSIGPTPSDTTEPSIAPTPSAPVQTAAPEPTAAPRDDWSTAFTIEPGPYSRLRGVAEARDKLFALGRSGRTQPAIWVSQDSTSWTAAEVPAMTERLPGADGSSSDLAAIVVDVEDAGDRLVALANVGLAEGSGLFGTMIYVSEDEGQTWTEVPSTPGTTAAAMFDLVRHGDRLIAVGTAIWASDDGGLSWTADAATIGGTLYAVDVHGDLIVAAGDGGNGDLSAPPAIALVSTDGDSWERIVIDPDAGASSVAIGPSGRVVVGGHRNADPLIWVSGDAGATWETTSPSAACCAGDLVATPTGYVAAASASFEGALLSSDGTTWTPAALDSGLSAVDWGPRFGLTGATDDAVLLGPVPAP